MEFKIKIGADNITPKLERIRRQMDALPREAYKVFKDETPRKSGNARRKTKYRKDTIIADYPYAKRLDEGYSKKAPKGMWEPTVKFIKRTMRQIMRKI
jgi:hypothetical protein